MKNYITQIGRLESGELTHDEMIELFQFLVVSGIIAHLQGSYQRQANDLIMAGEITT